MIADFISSLEIISRKLVRQTTNWLEYTDTLGVILLYLYIYDGVSFVSLKTALYFTIFIFISSKVHSTYPPLHKQRQ